MGIAGYPRKIAVVTPVFNDWMALDMLLSALEKVAAAARTQMHVIVVDDGSNETAGPWTGIRNFQWIKEVEVISLVCNLGHQRAIAVGLAIADQLDSFDGVIVIDSDGEDRPEDVPVLLDAAAEHPGHIICARRAKRSETLIFKACYQLYKLAFRLLSGSRIDFGNYCYVPSAALRSIVHNPNTWNHLAATIVRSRIPYQRISTERGNRYAGISSMNLVTLVLHGLSAISVYSDVALVRILVLMLSLCAFTSLGIVLTFLYRFLTNLAIPGWATTVVGSLGILFLQSLIFAFISAFMLLGARSTKPVIPAIDASQYVLRRERHLGEVRKDPVSV